MISFVVAHLRCWLQAVCMQRVGHVGCRVDKTKLQMWLGVPLIKYELDIVYSTANLASTHRR
ncbi:hypothetical protein AUR66_08215 [Haloferax profundi]|uniref:Uncharacterized protein n=1 Tax=Haloferax profundi TaxID=1544718 RepID=A0A0W1SVB7_9EURY|nr:hypothetical protein AUR66_08215 [Haloferax profundi]